MKISRTWLEDWLTLENPQTTTEELVEKLVQLGHEVDAVEPEGAAFNNVVVGHIQTRVPHPDSDHLGVCTVDVGESEPRTIVCGAPNARDNLTVAVALDGAVLPGDFVIKQSKIRGVVSNGMICSVRELGLGDEHEGIWELETTAKVGTPLAEALNKTDVILDVAVTPNRGDALSVYGLARDLAAVGLGTFTPLTTPKIGSGESSVKVSIAGENTKAFCGVEIANFQNGPSPDWMQRRLIQAGLRPRSLGVDVTNYIMLTFGRPLHAYDADKLQGHIVAKDAQGGEKFTGIGDVNLTLQAGDAIICDESGILGLGGILGGEGTAISDATTRIFLEGAWFNRDQIAKTGQAHNLITDARYRMERGIDPSLTVAGVLKAVELLVEYGGANVKASTPYIAGSFEPEVATIAYAPSFCETFGGLAVAEARQQEILTKLGFESDFSGTTWQLKAPAWRTYMSTPEDIVEEILRVVGYEAIPAKLPPQALKTLPLAESAPVLPLEKGSRRHLAAMGFLETITYSFIDEAAAMAFTEQPEALSVLDNPLDAETMTTMRPSLLPGLLRAAATNAARSTVAPMLAEVGKVFMADGEKMHAAGLYWPTEERHWQTAGQKQDKNAGNSIYQAKAAAMGLIEMAGINLASLQIKAPASPWFHPGRSGQLLLGKTVLAEFGELHPKLKPLFGLKGRVVLFNVDVDALSQQKVKLKAFTTSEFPPVERDLAFVVDEKITAQDLTRTVQNAIKPLGSDVSVFDVYQGAGMAEGKKSLAVSFTLQAPDKTLTDADINAVMEKAIQAVGKHWGGELRA